jgi:hypothetical protein
MRFDHVVDVELDGPHAEPIVGVRPRGDGEGVEVLVAGPRRMEQGRHESRAKTSFVSRPSEQREVVQRVLRFDDGGDPKADRQFEVAYHHLVPAPGGIRQYRGERWCPARSMPITAKPPINLSALRSSGLDDPKGPARIARDPELARPLRLNRVVRIIGEHDRRAATSDCCRNFRGGHRRLGSLRTTNRWPDPGGVGCQRRPAIRQDLRESRHCRSSGDRRNHRVARGCGCR